MSEIKWLITVDRRAYGSEVIVDDNGGRKEGETKPNNHRNNLRDPASYIVLPVICKAKLLAHREQYTIQGKRCLDSGRAYDVDLILGFHDPGNMWVMFYKECETPI